MKTLQHFWKLLEKKEPFAIARFNDGEMLAIKQIGSTVSRGDQPINPQLAKKLKQALSHKQKNYFVGLPHEEKYPKHFEEAKQIVGNYDYITSSIIFHDTNWLEAIYYISIYSINFPRITWVGNENHDLNKLPIKIQTHLKVKGKDAWSDYERIQHYKPKDGELILISAGPLGRVLAQEWFQENPNCFILEIGSIYDPWTRNVQHRYQRKRMHKAKLR